DLAYNVLDAFGGVKNIKYLDACITRVRVTVKNISLVNRSKLKSLGSADLMIIGDNIQAIFGPKSDMLKEQMKDIIDGKEVKVKKKKNIEKIEKGLKIESSIMMPVTGKLLRLEEVPDPIFSMKLIGDGFAIDPKKNILISPIKGMILTISKTSHSITIRGLDGFDIFIHIGIDSINLNGNGFKAFVQEGDIVNEGDLLIEFPLDEIREKLKSPMIPVIFKGLSKEKFIYFNNYIDVKSGDINKVEIHEKLNN
ncbi:MAG: glucose PTS transporter subunit IIA, partial [Clostridium sp.]|nr:glucose PTS transporter subunit IIA [Clostridium sp.]